MTDTLTLPPHSIEAEAAVLGAILIDPEAIEKTLHLKYSDFYHAPHQIIFRAILYLHNNTHDIDLITVSNTLTRHNKLNDAGGAYYISGLANNTPTAGNISTYANIVKEHSIQRQLKTAAYEFYSSAPEDMNGTVIQFQQVLEEILQDSPGVNHIRGLTLHSYTDYIEDETEEPDMIIEQGILPERGILIIGGQPKAGKSILALNLAYHLATGTQWLDFAIPKTRKTVVLQAENSYWNVRRRIRTMNNATEAPFLLPPPNKDTLTVSDPIALKINSLKDYLKMETIITRHSPDVLIIDPLVHFHSADENSNAEMGLVMEHFRTLANNHNLAVIIIHHSKKPGLNQSQGGMTLRGASAVFGAVDTAVVLARHTDPQTGETDYTLDFDIRNGENPERFYLDFDQTTLWLLKTDSPLPDMKEWIVAALVQVAEDGISQTLLVQAAKDEGFKESSVKKKISALIAKDVIRTDGKKRSRKLHYHTFCNTLELP
jgi:archaellum biogenesis ATPase FlaH|tara:strand:- start:392 stop:1855 length:1464 start_codon:yes stop_codon:yes gene_type:complete